MRTRSVSDRLLPRARHPGGERSDGRCHSTAALPARPRSGRPGMLAGPAAAPWRNLSDEGRSYILSSQVRIHAQNLCWHWHSVCGDDDLGRPRSGGEVEGHRLRANDDVEVDGEASAETGQSIDRVVVLAGLKGAIADCCMPSLRASALCVRPCSTRYWIRRSETARASAVPHSRRNPDPPGPQRRPPRSSSDRDRTVA